MNYVFEMSTDRDIRATGLHGSWEPFTRYAWENVRQGGLNIPAGATIVVIAHGNSSEIGNAQHGEVDINAEAFLATVQSNMSGNSQPRAVYISPCGMGIAEFAANVRILAEQNAVWSQTAIFGHNDAVFDNVPPASDTSWTQIF